LKISDLKKCWFHLRSLLAMISYHHLASSNSQLPNYSHDANHLISHCQTATANQMEFQSHCWRESGVISHSIQIHSKNHSRNHLSFLNRLVSWFACHDESDLVTGSSLITFLRDLSFRIKSIESLIQKFICCPDWYAFLNGNHCDG
jgi:hypothetical protein